MAMAGLNGVGFGAGQGSVANLSPLLPPGPITAHTFSSFGLALIFVLFAYDGWQSASHVAEEVMDPRKNLPRSIIGGLLMVMVIYIVVNIVYLLYLPLPELRTTDLVAAGTMEKMEAHENII